MILSVRLGEIEAMCDTETGGHAPDVALDYLNRCVDAVLRIHATLPADEAGPATD